MIYEVIGYRRAVYTVDERSYHGFQVSFCIPMTAQATGEVGTDLDGVDVFSFFVNKDKFPDFVPELNDQYDLFFNYYNGKRKLAQMYKK